MQYALRGLEARGLIAPHAGLSLGGRPRTDIRGPDASTATHYSLTPLFNAWEAAQADEKGAPRAPMQKGAPDAPKGRKEEERKSGRAASPPDTGPAREPRQGAAARGEGRRLAAAIAEKKRAGGNGAHAPTAGAAWLAARGLMDADTKEATTMWRPDRIEDGALCVGVPSRLMDQVPTYEAGLRFYLRQAGHPLDLAIFTLPPGGGAT